MHLSNPWVRKKGSRSSEWMTLCPKTGGSTKSSGLEGAAGAGWQATSSLFTPCCWQARRFVSNSSTGRTRPARVS